MKWDVFISHASEDKKSVAIPLVNLLKDLGVKAWLDKAEIRLGDSLSNKIEEGLSNSQHGLVILSKAFFEKNWTKRELESLISIELNSDRKILPIWHEIEHSDVIKNAPLISDKYALDTKNGLDVIANEIAEVVYETRPKPSSMSKSNDYVEVKRISILGHRMGILFLSVVDCRQSREFIRTLFLSLEARLHAMYDLLGRWDLALVFDCPENATLIEIENLVRSTLQSECQMHTNSDSQFNNTKLVQPYLISNEFSGSLGTIANTTLKMSKLKSEDEYDKYSCQKSFLYIDLNIEDRELLLSSIFSLLEKDSRSSRSIENIFIASDCMVLQFFMTSDELLDIVHINKILESTLGKHESQKYTLNTYGYDEQ